MMKQLGLRYRAKSYRIWIIKMRTLNRNSAHKELVSAHKTMRWVTQYGSLSVRKTDGRFIVRLEDFESQNVTIKSFATLAGAMVCAESLREYFL